MQNIELRGWIRPWGIPAAFPCLPLSYGPGDSVVISPDHLIAGEVSYRNALFLVLQKNRFPTVSGGWIRGETPGRWYFAVSCRQCQRSRSVGLDFSDLQGKPDPHYLHKFIREIEDFVFFVLDPISVSCLIHTQFHTAWCESLWDMPDDLQEEIDLLLRRGEVKGERVPASPRREDK